MTGNRTSRNSSILCLLLVLSLCCAAAAAEKGPGQKALCFTLKDVSGKDVCLEDFRGRVIVLSFWDCHADACNIALGAMNKIMKEYQTKDLVLISICFRFPEVMVRNNNEALLKNCYAGQVLLIDSDKTVKTMYGVLTAPTTYVIDRDLTIRSRVVGVAELHRPEFNGQLAQLVQQGL